MLVPNQLADDESPPHIFVPHIRRLPCFSLINWLPNSPYMRVYDNLQVSFITGFSCYDFASFLLQVHHIHFLF